MKNSAQLLCLTASLFIPMANLGAKDSAAGNTKAPPPPANVALAESPKSAVAIPQSVFVVPVTAREGRNPFFPNVPQPQVAQVHPEERKMADFSALVLNGLTGPPQRTAMINGSTFVEGEAGSVKLPGGSRMAVQCEKINDDGVIVVVGSERRELRLRRSL